MIKGKLIMSICIKRVFVNIYENIFLMIKINAKLVAFFILMAHY